MTKALGLNLVSMVAAAMMCAAVCVSVGMLSGCNIVAPAYYIIHGPEKVPAVHELDSKRPTVVFIDDRGNRLPRRALRQTIGDAAQQALLNEKAVVDMIDTRGAIAASSQDRAGQAMSIVDIGKAVGAEVVIYATVDSFTMSTDGQSFSPSATLRVKVIDVNADKRTWPDEKEGYPLSMTLPPRTSEIPRSAAELRIAEEEVGRTIGLGLAQLFYKYERAQGASRR